MAIIIITISSACICCSSPNTIIDSVIFALETKFCDSCISVCSINCWPSRRCGVCIYYSIIKSSSSELVIVLCVATERCLNEDRNHEVYCYVFKYYKVSLSNKKGVCCCIAGGVCIMNKSIYDTLFNLNPEDFINCNMRIISQLDCHCYLVKSNFWVKNR